MLTQKELHRLLSYDPGTGVFTYKVQVAHRVRVGDEAGYISADGYRVITLHSKRYLAHRLAFLYMEGSMPASIVDHINGQRSDNAWDNLREADKTFNAQNMRSAMRNNKTGYLGVSKHPDGKYQAKIAVNGKQKHLGLFATKEEAHAAYLSAKRSMHAYCTI